MTTLHGHVDEGLRPLLAELEQALATDPDLSFQVAALHRGRPVLDAWGGPHLGEDSVNVPYSVTKNTIGLVAGLLVQRGELDLDRPVADYWPEFAAKGKGAVTVRQLLSHQAGLPQSETPATAADLLDHHRAAELLAASRPLWAPGSGFGYHALTIGSLADELVFRATGRTLHEVYEQEIREPFGIDFFLGLPADQEHRLTAVLPVLGGPVGGPAPDPTSWIGQVMRVPGEQVDLANDPRSYRYGHPAASGVGSARGLARLLAAAVTGVDGEQPLLDAETVRIIGQQQVRGYDQVLGQESRAHAIVFQKPTSAMPFGGPWSFGHDGARGALAVVDPSVGLAFAYTVARGPWPGGADARAVRLAAALGRSLA